MKTDKTSAPEIRLEGQDLYAAPGVNESLVRIIGSCNQSCLFCNTAGLRGSMTVKDVYSQCRALNRNTVVPVFTGGEPTLHKDILTMIRVVREMGFPVVGVQTNAVKFANEKFAQSAARAGVNMAIVSLHSRDESTSDSITRDPGSFLKTLAGVNNMLAAGINVTINHVINSLNYRDPEKFVLFMHENLVAGKASLPGRVVSLSLSFVQPYGRAFNNKNIVPQISEAAPFFVGALALCDKLNITAANPGCGIPVCFTPGFEDKSSEAYLLKKQITETRTVSINRTEKIKSGACVTCRYDRQCFGLWINYAQMYGAGELTPVE